MLDVRSIQSYSGVSRPLGYLLVRIQPKIMKNVVATKEKRCPIYINVACTAAMVRGISTNQLSTM